MLNGKLAEIVGEIFEINSGFIDPSWKSDDVPGWDSVGHLILISEIEKEFNVKFEVEEMFEIEELGDLEIVLKRKSAI